VVATTFSFAYDIGVTLDTPGDQFRMGCQHARWLEFAADD